MSNKIISYIAIALSIFSLGLSSFTIAHYQNCAFIKPDYSVLLSAFAILVTVLVGWQIFSIVNLRDERQHWQGTLNEQSKQINVLKKEINDIMIAYASIQAVTIHESPILKIHLWLQIILECTKKKEADICINIASAYIVNELNGIAQSKDKQAKLPKKDYELLWSKEAFKIFMNRATSNGLLFDGTFALAEEILKSLRTDG